MIWITGIGSISDRRFGCLRRGCFGDQELGPKALHARFRDESILMSPIKNFGRFDPASKWTCLVVALALYDAELEKSIDRCGEIGILGNNEAGSLFSNRAYFTDYVEAGRTLARGNLFVYTLPSSPLAEASIHFGLCGPQIYMTSAQDRLPKVLACAGNVIRRGEADSMLVVESNECEATCFVLERMDRGEKRRLSSLEELVENIRNKGRFWLTPTR